MRGKPGKFLVVLYEKENPHRVVALGAFSGHSPEEVAGWAAGEESRHSAAKEGQVQVAIHNLAKEGALESFLLAHSEALPAEVREDVRRIALGSETEEESVVYRKDPPLVPKEGWERFIERVEESLRSADHVKLSRALGDIAPYLQMERSFVERYDEGLGVVSTYGAEETVRLADGGEVRVMFWETRTQYGVSLDQTEGGFLLERRGAQGERGFLHVRFQDSPSYEFHIEGRNLEIFGLNLSLKKQGVEHRSPIGADPEVEV